MGSGIQPQLELQLPPDGTRHIVQVPHFNTQFTPGTGATFLPLPNSIHPASDQLSLEDQKPELGQLQSHNAMVYPTDDGQQFGSIPNSGNQNTAEQQDVTRGIYGEVRERSRRLC